MQQVELRQWGQGIEILPADVATNRLATAGTVYTSNGEIEKVTIDGQRFEYGHDGSIMEQGAPLASWMTTIKEFSGEDAILLRDVLNLEGQQQR